MLTALRREQRTTNKTMCPDARADIVVIVAVVLRVREGVEEVRVVPRVREALGALGHGPEDLASRDHRVEALPRADCGRCAL